MLKKLQKLQKSHKDRGGFTIIEVMIVLAIAALILVVVLIAVPQLQRNQRNSARRDIGGRIKAELDNFAGNNNGNYPTENADPTTGFVNGFAVRYFQCAGIAPNFTACGINVSDPKSGKPVRFNNSTAIPAIDAASGAANVHYNLGALCNGEAPNGAGSSRQYALAISLEGGASFCLDNK